MGKNVGSVDRILRVIVGALLLALVFVGPQTPWGWIGLISIADRADRVVPRLSTAWYPDLFGWTAFLN